MREAHPQILTTVLALVTCLGCSSPSESLPELGTGTSGLGGTSASGGSGGRASEGGRTSLGSGGASVGGAGRSQGGGAGSSAQGGSTAGSGTAGTAGLGPVSSAPADVFEYYCLGCHGARGAGGTQGPEIQHPVRDYSSWVVRNGLPGLAYRDPMEPIARDVISDVVLESIWDWLDEPPQPTTGEALYHDYCGNCHGADGQGGPTMRPIVDELRELEDQVRNGSHLGEFDQRREYMPAFSTTRLSDAEVQLIYDYVESL